MTHAVVATYAPDRILPVRKAVEVQEVLRLTLPIGFRLPDTSGSSQRLRLRAAVGQDSELESLLIYVVGIVARILSVREPPRIKAIREDRCSIAHATPHVWCFVQARAQFAATDVVRAVRTIASQTACVCSIVINKAARARGAILVHDTTRFPSAGERTASDAGQNTSAVQKAHSGHGKLLLQRSQSNPKRLERRERWPCTQPNMADGSDRQKTSLTWRASRTTPPSVCICRKCSWVGSLTRIR